jgi:Cys-tRNA(Pro)/Cys-tRNA(Cys) deacylase
VNKSNIAKTNAVRVLDGLGIAYTLHPYEVDESDLSAETVARKVGLPLEQVYKTLLVESERREHAFAVVAGGDALDLKAVAKSLGWKSAEMVALKEVQPLTGYIRGGVTALAPKKAFPVVIDEYVEAHDEISISAGQRGLQIFLSPRDYVRATNGKLAPIAKSAGAKNQ